MHSSIKIYLSIAALAVLASACGSDNSDNNSNNNNLLGQNIYSSGGQLFTNAGKLTYSSEPITAKTSTINAGAYTDNSTETNIAAYNPSVADSNVVATGFDARYSPVCDQLDDRYGKAINNFDETIEAQNACNLYNSWMGTHDSGLVIKIRRSFMKLPGSTWKVCKFGYDSDYNKGLCARVSYYRTTCNGVNSDFGVSHANTVSLQCVPANDKANKVVFNASTNTASTTISGGVFVKCQFQEVTRTTGTVTKPIAQNGTLQAGFQVTALPMPACGPAPLNQNTPNGQ